MKRSIIILHIMIMLSYCLKAQTISNNKFTFTYTGYVQDHYKVTIESKLPCDHNYKVSWNNRFQDSAILVPGKSIYSFSIKAPFMPGTVFRILGPSDCGNDKCDPLHFTVPSPAVLSIIEKPKPRPREHTSVQEIVYIYDYSGKFLRKQLTSSVFKAAAGLPRGVYIAVHGGKREKFLML